VQEAFLQVYQHIDQFDETRSFRPWFLRIVVNSALKTVKRQKRLVPLEPASRQDWSDPEPAQVYPGLRFEQKEFSLAYDEAECLQGLLGQLSLEHRTVLELKYFLEMSDEEIAEAVQIPTGTVKSRLHAAKRKIGALAEESKLTALLGEK
jgi:RNA polymerase sigma-70 factor (ECF subfamily)